ncbi:hypothetical protein PANA5342_1990 [Pantoea ananatis LMG 5342]|nr:hypothetical protein PANA5342_1990 [Pantoea ananatis LMG 5342]
MIRTGDYITPEKRSGALMKRTDISDHSTRAS